MLPLTFMVRNSTARQLFPALVPDTSPSSTATQTLLSLASLIHFATGESAEELPRRLSPFPLALVGSDDVEAGGIDPVSHCPSHG
jgi:hypothetical protein